MVVWTVANQKGGVGKTTTTVSMGGILAEQGHRVLLVDTDPHASLTYYFGIDSEDLELSVYDLFILHGEVTQEQVIQTLCPSSLKGMDFLPATMALATLDRKLGTQSGMGLILKSILNLIYDEYDYVIIDCPPVLGVLLINAVAASSRLVVPVQTEFLALKGLDRMVRTIKLMERTQNMSYNCTIVPTMFDKRTNASVEAYHELKRLYGKAVWHGVIPVDTKLRDASVMQLAPSVFAPKSRGVFAYKKLIEHLESIQVSGETNE